MSFASKAPRSALRAAGGFASATALAAALLAGCAGEPVRPLPPAPIPAQAAAPPPVSLSAHALEAASVFRAYVRRAAATPASFPTGPAVEEALTTGETYEPKQLAQGLIAFGALVALQDPAFVAGVRTYAVDPASRRSMADRLAADPSYAAALPGAAGAAGLVIGTLDAEAAKLRRAGEGVKAFAYSVQHQPWSKKDVLDPQGRLARAKTASAAALSPDASEVTDLRGAVDGAGAKVAPRSLLVSGEAAAPPYTPLVSRALALAALAALGEGGDDNAAEVDQVLGDPNGGFCLGMSKLNLYQCLAVAKPWYEDVFCLGQHVLLDTAACISKDVGDPRPVQVAGTPAPGAASAAPVTAGAPAAGARAGSAPGGG